jgi:3-isopropylmalate dehydrogenase
MKATITLLPGDGIGPEVVSAASDLLNAVSQTYKHEFKSGEYLVGGCAIDATGSALPEETLNACKRSDAVLLGAVGGPKWDDPGASVRPEQGLLGLRKELELFANLRPIKPHPDLIQASPVDPERLAGVDLIVVRELTGGLYFGQPRMRRVVDGQAQAVDTMTYTESEVSRVAHLAFRLAQQRHLKVTSIDKANVLECSRLWRQTVNEVAKAYPEVTLEHLLVDAAAMHLITRPATFDVMLTENLFGDILTDEASVLTGSMGNLPSASLGDTKNTQGFPRGLYEPIHGSAPDIAGKGIANPVGTILSVAMLLRHSLGLETEALTLENAVYQVLSEGYRTADIAQAATQQIYDTQQMAALITQKFVELASVGDPTPR